MQSEENLLIADLSAQRGERGTAMNNEITERWMLFQKNGWGIRKEYVSEFHVSRVYVKNPKNGRELLLGQYEEHATMPTTRAAM